MSDTLLRAHALLLETKGTEDGDQRILHGLASTPEPDNVGDTLDQFGCTHGPHVPLLWQHKSDAPLGHVRDIRATDRGLEIVAQIARVTEPGRLRDRLDESWHSIKAGLVRGLSVGFTGRGERNEHGGRHYRSWRLVELSTVTCPMNEGATILAVKAADLAVRLAAARRPIAVPEELTYANASSIPRGAKSIRLGDLESFVYDEPRPEASPPAPQIVKAATLDYPQMTKLANAISASIVPEFLKRDRRVASLEAEIEALKAEIATLKKGALGVYSADELLELLRGLSLRVEDLARLVSGVNQ